MPTVLPVAASAALVRELQGAMPTARTPGCCQHAMVFPTGLGSQPVILRSIATKDLCIVTRSGDSCIFGRGVWM